MQNLFTFMVFIARVRLEINLAPTIEVSMQKPISSIPRFIAVIHAFNSVQVLEQANMAFSEGAEGIFLINHSERCTRISWEELNILYGEVRTLYPNEWIGINYLDLHFKMAHTVLPKDAQALWTDCLPIKPFHLSGTNQIRFGGVAFKYQPQVLNLQIEVEKAVGLTDVLTTSGKKTGEPPTVEKIKSIRKFAGNSSLLAIASGLNTNNVNQFIPFIDCCIVATGISKSFYEFDHIKIKSFASALNESQ